MKTTFNYDGRNLFTPTVFLDDFNKFAPISATQAWSLFFTASREDTALGTNPEAGKFWSYTLIASAVTGILATLIFHPIY
ncbi:hypothetical protein V2H45_13050 [Tumidithrix elongata RA019]|uniref:Uncharacterized protein n=1 Tax=Tumidithrix elongata BACA0141 TaxID=2716417 RepID=A0AAW9Q449_9CYAN|nr:hypothetical protein [Tumidithrix elongata RA019]